MAVLFPDLQRTSFGGTDEEALLHVRTTRLSNLRGANQVQRIHEAVLLLTLDRGNCLSLDLELLIGVSPDFRISRQDHIRIFVTNTGTLPFVISTYKQ